MKKKVLKTLLLSCVIFTGACVTQENFIFPPPPDFAEGFTHVTSLYLENIIESKGGPGNSHLPEWLLVYLNYGINEIERKDSFINRYCFIETFQGSNFDALNKWTENFSLTLDFPKLAAARIERRMIRSATLFPDDEYGQFFEKLIKKAFNTQYPNALLEDTYWIKKTSENDSAETYVFFVFISIDKEELQGIITRMMNEVLAAVSPTRAQNNAIRQLQQNFFEDF